MTAPAAVEILRLPDGFDRWNELLGLIRSSFAYMDGVIDPPSSMHRLDIASLAQKARDESVFIARSERGNVGCVFLAMRGDHAYLGKLAVDPACQGAGIGRLLVEAAESEARSRGLAYVELQTRIELAGNQEAFARLGYAETKRTAHPGYDRPTSVTMRKVLA